MNLTLFRSALPIWALVALGASGVRAATAPISVRLSFDHSSDRVDVEVHADIRNEREARIHTARSLDVLHINPNGRIGSFVKWQGLYAFTGESQPELPRAFRRSFVLPQHYRDHYAGGERPSAWLVVLYDRAAMHADHRNMWWMADLPLNEHLQYIQNIIDSPAVVAHSGWVSSAASDISTHADIAPSPDDVMQELRQQEFHSQTLVRQSYSGSYTYEITLRNRRGLYGYLGRSRMTENWHLHISGSVVLREDGQHVTGEFKQLIVGHDSHTEIGVVTGRVAEDCVMLAFWPERGGSVVYQLHSTPTGLAGIGANNLFRKHADELSVFFERTLPRMGPEETSNVVFARIANGDASFLHYSNGLRNSHKRQGAEAINLSDTTASLRMAIDGYSHDSRGAILPFTATYGLPMAIVGVGEWGVFVTDQQTATEPGARYTTGPRLRIHIARRRSGVWSPYDDNGRYYTYADGFIMAYTVEQAFGIAIRRLERYARQAGMPDEVWQEIQRRLVGGGVQERTHPVTDDASRLRYSLSPLRKIFRVGEEFTVELMFQNQGHHPVALNVLDCSFRLIAGDGRAWFLPGNELFEDMLRERQLVPAGGRRLFFYRFQATDRGACVYGFRLDLPGLTIDERLEWSIETPVLKKEYFLEGVLRIHGAPRYVHNGFGAGGIFDSEGAGRIEIHLLPSGTSRVMNLQRMALETFAVRGNMKRPLEAVSVRFPNGIERLLPSGRTDVSWDNMYNLYNGTERLVICVEDPQLRPGDGIAFAVLGADMAWTAMETILKDVIKGLLYPRQ